MDLDAQLRDYSGGESVQTARSAVGHDSASLAGDVTRILSQVEHDGTQTAEQLLPLVYDELRRLAAQALAGEKPGQTLQATGLVHEAYLRLVNVEQVQRWDSRSHFFVAAAKSMRRILVENARRKNRVRRGGDARRQYIELELLPVPQADQEVIAVDEALERLAAERPEVAKLVELRYFAGLSPDEAAAAAQCVRPHRPALLGLRRAWLHQELAAVPRRPTACDSSGADFPGNYPPEF